MDKLKSRKFWVCVAAMLSSIATSIAGLTTDNQTVLVIGTICGVASAAIYAFCEAWVDGKAVNQTDDVFFGDFEDSEEDTLDSLDTIAEHLKKKAEHLKKEAEK